MPKFTRKPPANPLPPPMPLMPPMEPHMDNEQVDLTLRILRDRYARDAAAPYCRYEPADGTYTRARRTEYIRSRYNIWKRAMWYNLHGNEIKRIRRTSSPFRVPIANYSDQVMTTRHSYSLAHRQGFTTDPWENHTINDYFEKRPGRKQKPREGVRAGWTFERGFEKTFREEPQWQDINFDDPELAPEEVTSNEVAKAWVESYLERSAEAKQAAGVTRKCPAQSPTSQWSTFYSEDLDKHFAAFDNQRRLRRLDEINKRATRRGKERRSWLPKLLITKLKKFRVSFRSSIRPLETHPLDLSRPTTPLLAAAAEEPTSNLATDRINTESSNTSSSSEQISDSSSRSTIRPLRPRANSIEIVIDMGNPKAEAETTEPKPQDRVNSSTELE